MTTNNSTTGRVSRSSSSSFVLNPLWTSTLLVLCVISMIKGADLQLLPTSFRAMEVELSMVPSRLALMAVCQGVSVALTGPFWGALVEAGADRSKLLMAGVGCWGCCTFLLGLVSSFETMCLLRVLNGMSLSALLPVTQSFVVDISGPDERGQTFGWLVFSAHVGSVLACMFVTPISGITFYGITGWRIACMAVGVLSLSAMLLIHWTIGDTVVRKWDPSRVSLTGEFKKLARFLRIPSFTVIIVQGVFGTIPGAAMSFLTMYFQYIGLTDVVVALINTVHIIGAGVGGLIGGVVGDILTAWKPQYGRAITAQISVLFSVPLVCLMFSWIPRETAMAPIFAGTFFLYGLVSSWTAPGCLCPIMSEIVPKRSLASAYAWELAIVFCSGNLFGPVLVGYLSQRVYGYVQNTDSVDSMDPTVRDSNAKALGHSLFLAVLVPYTISSVILSFLFCTHPRDSMDPVSASESETESTTAASASSRKSLLTEATEKTTLISGV